MSAVVNFAIFRVKELPFRRNTLGYLHNVSMTTMDNLVISSLFADFHDSVIGY